MTADGRTSEWSRQSVHVLMGAVALTLPWLTWPYAVLLGVAGVLFNLVLLPRISPRLFRPEDRRQPLLSGIVLPLTLAPLWIRNVAALNPLSYAVDATRALFIGQIGDPSVALGFIIMAVLALLATWWAARSFRQATT